jgi:hypothetical protein
MDSKFCSSCYQKRLITSFFKDPSNSKSKVLKTCTMCRSSTLRSQNKRKALQPLAPNVPSKRPAIARTKPAEAPSIPPPYIQSETHIEAPICPPPLPASRPQQDVSGQVVFFKNLPVPINRLRYCRGTPAPTKFCATFDVPAQHTHNKDSASLLSSPN